MKVDFYKIKPEGSTFNIELEGLKFEGSLKELSSKLIECKAKLYGKTPHICDRCGDDIELFLDEELNLTISDGAFASDTLDIVEFFDGKIDLEELAQGEIEAIKSDYYYCEKCKNL